MKAVKMSFYAAALVVMLCAFTFPGCATTANNAQTSVFQIQQQYNHALQIGVWYGDMELCTAPTHDPIFCADPAVVVKIKNAKDVAGPAIAAAQATVRNPLFDESTASRITVSAQAAVGVLIAVTTPLEALFAKAVAAGKAKALSLIAPDFLALPVPEMRALPAYNSVDAPPAFAVLPLVLILNLLTQLLEWVPKGTALWAKYQADKAIVEQIVAENREPTPEEWDTLNAETKALEDQIDRNAERATGV